jgi:hypothetical protein
MIRTHTQGKRVSADITGLFSDSITIFEDLSLTAGIDIMLVSKDSGDNLHLPDSSPAVAGASL